jgi:hypothetical protein
MYKSSGRVNDYLATQHPADSGRGTACLGKSNINSRAGRPPVPVEKLSIFQQNQASTGPGYPVASGIISALPNMA